MEFFNRLNVKNPWYQVQSKQTDFNKRKSTSRWLGANDDWQWMFEQCWSRAKSKPQMAFWFLLGAKCSTIDEWIANKAIYRISIELLIQQLLKITFSQMDGSNQQFVVGIRVCYYYCYFCIVYSINEAIHPLSEQICVQIKISWRKFSAFKRKQKTWKGKTDKFQFRKIITKKKHTEKILSWDVVFMRIAQYLRWMQLIW